MRIFVAGATGSLGRPVVRLLRAAGHEVFALTRSEQRARALEAEGVHASVGDALDDDRVRQVVTGAQPEIVVHLLTALPPGGALRPSQLRATNRLRVAGTGNLLRAAIEAGVRRLVAESFVAVEMTAAGAFKEAVVALRSLEQQLHAARADGRIETVALRIGLLYGADVPSTKSFIAQARRGRLFLPRDRGGVAPFVHIDDAAAAVIAAIEQAQVGPTYNIVDDAPISVNDFGRELAQAVGAPPPRHLPAWLLRLAAPVVADAAAARLVLSNAAAKHDLQWTPRYSSVRHGMRELTVRNMEAA